MCKIYIDFTYSILAFCYTISLHYDKKEKGVVSDFKVL